jgi:GNAT superfamily N-acetyltransferase
MTEDLTIRSAAAADLPDLLPLYKHLNPDDSPLDLNKARRNLEQISRSEGSAVLVGLIGDAIATTCTLIVIANLTRGGAPYALIENVVTDPTYRKRGLGKAILAHAITEAWEHGCYKVMLLTGSTKSETLKFYGDAGFTQNKTGFQIRRP